MINDRLFSIDRKYVYSKDFVNLKDNGVRYGNVKVTDKISRFI